MISSGEYSGGLINKMIKSKDLLIGVALVIIYFFSAKFGLSLSTSHPSITAIWPPTGISLAALVILGLRYWPGILIGAFLINVGTSGDILSSVLIATGNTLEALVGAYLVNIFANGRRAFDSLQNVVRFVFLGLISPTISASIGTTALYAAGFKGSLSYPDYWFTWWLGDASSAIIIAPLVILWANNWRANKYRHQQIAEIILLLATLTILSRAIFGGFFFNYTNYPLEFLVIPILAWVSIRFTPRGAMTSVAIIATIATWGTFNGYGPFIGSWPADYSFVFLQVFLMTIAATSLALAVAVWERKQTEEALQRADAVKDEFLTTLSHELRNPLASIFGYLQLIQIGSAKYAKKRKAMENIESDLRHITSLLDDLLDLSRVRRGKIKLQKEQVEVNTIVKEVIDGLKPIVEEHNHTLIIKKFPMPIWIEADLKRVKQILVNLLSNAVKYTEPGGEIKVSSYVEGDYASITVEDNGQGMSPDMFSKIFDMFNQEGRPASRTKKGFRGLGIGLTVVKKFVELHGGSVQAYSQGLGKGSRFTVSFPLSKYGEKINFEKYKEERQSTISIPHQSRLRVSSKSLDILIVDDNEKAADSLFELLTHLGHRVTVSYNGVDALRAAQKNRPRVVVLDIGLPDLDGYEVGITLRAKYKKEGQELLLVALSGYGQPEDIKRSEEAGFNYHLVKPIDVMFLQRLLMEANF